MDEHETGAAGPSLRIDQLVRWIILGIEYAIVAGLLLVASVVLVRTVANFLRYGHDFPNAVVAAIDGILVVIIILDIAHTVFGHLRSSVFPIRPFLIIGILAGVRDILSASAHLTLSGPFSQRDFYNTLISLAVGVGVVISLLLGLLILRFSGPVDVADAGDGLDRT
ncbi:MAG TPA: phosphate-starvation-inducible PsiE family protein [Acidimicrobiales bacterium]|nr:phosphate-starvation-inducible PsiE family protein [Acidimicrobiales bacterium]